MSYSFTAKGVTKAAAFNDAAAKFDAIVTQQPVHEADRAAVMANVSAAVDLLREPGEGEEVRVNANGYLSWNAGVADEAFNTVSVNASASIGKIEA